MAVISVTVLAVGKLKEPFFAAACDEYAKRLGAYCKFQLLELTEARLPERPLLGEIQAGLAKEAEVIRKKIPKGAFFCVCTPEGTELSSEKFAAALARAKGAGNSSFCFLIGGSCGIDPTVKAMADLRLSMGPMTFPHHLFRVMLLEQIYRAETIQAGTKYHK